MTTARDFLRQECANLRAVLDDTLRFKFGLDGSKEFYEECAVRLEFLEAEIAAIDPADHRAIIRIRPHVLQLSGLISRIERSSISEYSWPFVEELKRLAIAICSEETLTDPNSTPKIHVLSDGGLDKYAIYTESNRPSTAGKRILTIVFPRSLKHSVLLHSILGHEIGHAMWQCSKHQKELKAAVRDSLQSRGPFSSESETISWLYSSNAPSEIRQQLAQFSTRGIDQSNFFQSRRIGFASWSAWIEEVICDFVGLLTFGPSFLAAGCALLCSLDPTGASLGPKHPPVGCRINYLLAAASAMGLDSRQFKSSNLAAIQPVVRCI
jgi:hypothetical protein